MQRARSLAASAVLFSLCACNSILGNEEGRLAATSGGGGGGGGAGPPCVHPFDATKASQLGGLGLVSQAKSQVTTGTGSLTSAFARGINSELALAGALDGKVAIGSDPFTFEAHSHFIANVDPATGLTLYGPKEVPGPGVALPSMAAPATFYATEFSGQTTIDGMPIQGNGPGKNVVLVRFDEQMKIQTARYLSVGQDEAVTWWAIDRTTEAPVVFARISASEGVRTHVFRFNAALDTPKWLLVDGAPDALAGVHDAAVDLNSGAAVLSVAPKQTLSINGVNSETLEDPAKVGVVVRVGEDGVEWVSLLHGLSADQVSAGVQRTFVAGRILTPGANLVIGKQERAQCGKPGSAFVAALGADGKPEWMGTLAGLEAIHELVHDGSSVALLGSATGPVEFGDTVANVPAGLVVIQLDQAGTVQWVQNIVGLKSARLASAQAALALYGEFSGSLALGKTTLVSASPAGPADFLALLGAGE